MNRYIFLFVINIPFIIFGILRAFVMFRSSTIAMQGLIARLTFWLLIALGLGFSQQLYAWLYREGLVNGKEMSLTVALLTTGIIFCFFLIIRIYSKLEAIERRQTELLTKLSLVDSEALNKR